MTGSATVIQADSRHLPLADDSVDLIVTSPPYFALRSYQDGGEHYAGQVGDEATPAEFVQSLLEVTAECVRVLKPSGSMFVNLGDKYAGSGPGGPQNGTRQAEKTLRKGRQGLMPVTDVRPKSLIGLPWRYALACIDQLGLILRAEIIWSKPNGLPESVTDRVRRSHEQWFHMTLNARYYSAVDEIREPSEWRPNLKPGGRSMRQGGEGSEYGAPRGSGNGFVHNALGKLPGSVWVVPTEPLSVPAHLGVDHFAAYPTAWPKRIITGWSPREVCTGCGEGRRPVVSSEKVGVTRLGASHLVTHPGQPTHRGGHTHGLHTITDYACECWPPTGPVFGIAYADPDRAADDLAPPRTTPGVVLDPFGGTGTTALVAKALGRHGITVDMSADYCRLAEWRVNDRNQLAHVLDLDRIPQPDPDQLDLFGEATA